MAARVALVCVCAQASTVKASAVHSVPVTKIAANTAKLGLNTAVSKTSQNTSDSSMVIATWPTATVGSASPLPQCDNALM